MTGAGHLENHMQLLVGAIVVLIALEIIIRVRARGIANEITLGWISEQWLAEHRAAHSA